MGLMALDLIKRRGATAVGTASGSKHATLRRLGYDELVDYRGCDYEEALRHGPLFDLVMDPLGGRNWAKGLRLLKKGGKLVCYGMSVNASGSVAQPIRSIARVLSIPWIGLSPPRLINDNKGVFGINMGRMWSEQDRLRGWLETLLALVVEGPLRVMIHARIPFSRAREAHQILHERENLGKVLLIPDRVDPGPTLKGPSDAENNL